MLNTFAQLATFALFAGVAVAAPSSELKAEGYVASVKGHCDLLGVSADLAAAGAIVHSDVEMSHPGAQFIHFSGAPSMASEHECVSFVSPNVMYRVTNPTAGMDDTSMGGSEDPTNGVCDDPVSCVSPLNVPSGDIEGNSWGACRIGQASSSGCAVNYNTPHNNNCDNKYVNPMGFGEDIKVYVLDSGIVPHVYFSNRIISSTSIVTGTGVTHGSHVAGIIGAERFGLARRVKLVDVRVLNNNLAGTTTTLISGINYAVTNCGSDKCIINISVQASAKDPATDWAIQNAWNHGLLVIVSAGNSATNPCTKSPASACAAVVVGATAINDAIASYSNYGSCVGIFAPGNDIASVGANTAKTYYMNGTSVAAPHVSGVAAVLWGVYKSLNNLQVKSLLYQTSALNKVTGTIGSSANRMVQFSSAPDCSWLGVGEAGTKCFGTDKVYSGFTECSDAKTIYEQRFSQMCPVYTACIKIDNYNVNCDWITPPTTAIASTATPTCSNTSA